MISMEKEDIEHILLHLKFGGSCIFLKYGDKEHCLKIIFFPPTLHNLKGNW